MTNINVFNEESYFNEKINAFKDVDIYGQINTSKIITSAVPGFEGVSAGLLASSKNRIYVSTAGDDANGGLSADDPVKTLKKAVEIARNQFAPTDKKSIYISSGDYTEDTPIILPTFCAVIGDSLRTVILRPSNPDVDFFKVREGVMLMNLVFRDNESGNFTFRYAIAYDESEEKLVINQSPYALNCSLISTRGRGKNAYSIVAGQWTKGQSQTPRGSFAYVDGNAVDSISSGDSVGGNLESMVFALLSIITPGIGIHIDNCAYAQIVNVFGIFNTDNILCENGGYASVTNSATNFGINALRSVGFSTVSKTYSQDVGIVAFSCASAVGVGSTNYITIAGAATTIPASQSIIGIVDDNTGDSLISPSINNLIRIGYASTETPFVHPSIEFQIRKVSDAKTISYGGTTRTAYDVAVYPRLDQYFSSPYTNYSSFQSKSIRQLRPSVVNSSSHTWEYAGSGTDYSALPKNGGFTRVLNEQIEENYGQVYTSGTNELGDFKVGNFVILKNQTGEVQFTTPIPIAQIDRINFTSGNTNLVITGVENDTQMGGANPSDNFLSTQRAVNVFVSSGSTTLTNKIISAGSNTITGLTNSNLSGNAGITNANLATPTISGVSLGSNLNTLTLNTSGTGLSGSTTYNGSSLTTFTVTSNATSSNTSSTIVARDSSGDFSAGTITATTFSGSGASLTSIPNTATTATSSNTGSAIVARDSSGNFSAGTITANSFVKSGGTSSQFLKADGSIDSTVYATANSFNGTLSNTLTMNTSGSGLSGSATYNNSGATTFTVTSNATSSNTGSTIIARDSSGNFSAGTITATTFSGSGASLTSIPNTATTATSSNTGSAIVARDSSGNFSAGLITSATAFRVGNANLSSGGDYAHLATYEYYNGSSWVYSSATAGGLYQITGQAHNWYKHNGSGTHTTLLTLDASGNLVATANVSAYSDIKLKKDIESIQGALDKVLKLRGVTFIRKDIPNDGIQMGVIAQEVEKIVPEVVKLTKSETPEGTIDEVKTVAYGNMVGLLIEAIKDQQKIIENLQKRVEDLENE
jgi:hypothetical protein